MSTSPLLQGRVQSQLTSPLSYRQLKPSHGPRLNGWYCTCVVWLNFSSWSMRNTPGGCGRCDPADCRGEEARGDVGHHDKCRQTMKIRNASTNGKARNLGIVPFDGEGNWGGAEHVEVVAIVRVLPNVLAAQDEILSEGLLQAGVKFIAKTGGQR